MLKIRTEEKSNYRGIYFNGKTMRIKLDPRKPITELEYPEFYDVKITDYCEGKCPYCYQNSTPDDESHSMVLRKINEFFGSMTENQKPFQVAIGGGEPTSHLLFPEILKKFHELGIMPNYTTNGMFIKQPNCKEIIEATKLYSEAVAVSCHPHLNEYWTRAVEMFVDNGVMVNTHNIIGDKKSIDEFIRIYELYRGIVSYFVLLPMMAQGRSKENLVEWEYLTEKLSKYDEIKDIAFGANFYPYLCKDKGLYDVSLYEPEILSKYLVMKDMSIHPSSFNVRG